MTFPSPPAIIPDHLRFDTLAHEKQFELVDTALRQAIQVRLTLLLPVPAGPPLPLKTPVGHAHNLLRKFGLILISYHFEPADEVAKHVHQYKLSNTYGQLRQELNATGWHPDNLQIKKVYLDRETLELSIQLRVAKVHMTVAAVC